MTSLLAIVPARSGSKGVPGKNKALIGGKPLIEYTLDALIAARCVTGRLVTTDDAEIISWYRCRRDLFMVARPDALAGDTSSTTDAVRHALLAWESAGNPTPDVLLLAQPTTPLRTAGDIDGAFDLFESTGRAPLVSVCRVDGIRHPRVMYRVDEAGSRGVPYIGEGISLPCRQGYERLYQRNGAIYLVTVAHFRETGELMNNSPVIYEMPWERSINIDGPGDMLIAKALLESGLLPKGNCP